MRHTSPIERLQALLVSRIAPSIRADVAAQVRAAAHVELMAGLATDDDEALAEWVATTLQALDDDESVQL